LGFIFTILILSRREGAGFALPRQKLDVIISVAPAVAAVLA
jgi:hypothetical protein